MFSIVVDSLLSNVSRSAQLTIFIPGNLPIILELFFMLSYFNYSQNYSGIIDWSLFAIFSQFVINLTKILVMQTC